MTFILALSRAHENNIQIYFPIDREVQCNVICNLVFVWTAAWHSHLLSIMNKTDEGNYEILHQTMVPKERLIQQENKESDTIFETLKEELMEDVSKFLKK